MADPIIAAKNATTQVVILPHMANRHGLVAGATGTGKTVTLQALAEGFSRAGVPVFAADVKGDLAGASQAGGGNAEGRRAPRRAWAERRAGTRRHAR